MALFDKFREVAAVRAGLNADARDPTGVVIDEILSPTAPEGPWDDALIDYNIRAERMGWLPSAPQLKSNPLDVAKAAEKAGKEPARSTIARSVAS